MKKTVIMILAALMTIGLSSAAASEAQETVIRAEKKSKKKAEIKDVTFNVHLHCENCVAKVFDNMSRAKGVKDLEVSLDNQTVAIKYDASKTSEETLKASIEKLGYPVSGKVEKGHQHKHEGHDHGHDPGHDHGHKH